MWWDNVETTDQEVIYREFSLSEILIGVGETVSVLKSRF